MRPLISLFLAAGLAMTAPVAFAEDAEAAAPEAAAPVLPAIYIAEVGTRQLADRIIASGLIGPVEQIQVQPLIEGQPIESLLVDVGDMVQAGQVMAVLSKSTLELSRAQSVAGLASARATIAQAEAQLLEAESSAAEAARVADRTAKLREQGSASQAATDTTNAAAVSATARVTVARQSLEAARAQLALNEAQLANVELQLTRTEVKAPVAGKIVARNATVGAIATAAGNPMFTLEKDGALELRADLSEADMQRVAMGQRAEMRAVGIADVLLGKIRLIEPTIDSVTRLGRVRISVEGAVALRTGMFVEATILVAEHDAVAVPVTAVGSADGQSTVMRVKDAVVERVVVKTGIRDGGFIEIVEGLAAGDMVVVKAASFVRPGDKINPVLAPVTN